MHVWNSRSVPQDWKDALLIPEPKKEDCHFATIDGESALFMEVIGKVFA